MSKHGEMSWTDTTVDGSKKSGKDSFLRLNQGSNVVRLLTLPHAYYQHKHIIPGGKKYGYRINCADPEHRTTCPVCKAGSDKAKRRWFLGVIDRKTNTYKILDIGFAVFKAVQLLAKDDDWGDPSRYDIDIVVDPNGGPANYYAVVAKPPKPLSAADLLIKEENTSEVLDRRAAPPTPEKVQEKLDAIMEEIASGTAPAASDDEESTDDEPAATDKSFFKNYDETKKSKEIAF